MPITITIATKTQLEAGSDAAIVEALQAATLKCINNFKRDELQQIMSGDYQLLPETVQLPALEKRQLLAAQAAASDEHAVLRTWLYFHAGAQYELTANMLLIQPLLQSKPYQEILQASEVGAWYLKDVHHALLSQKKISKGKKIDHTSARFIHSYVVYIELLKFFRKGSGTEIQPLLQMVCNTEFFQRVKTMNTELHKKGAEKFDLNGVFKKLLSETIELYSLRDATAATVKFAAEKLTTLFTMDYLGNVFSILGIAPHSEEMRALFTLPEFHKLFISKLKHEYYFYTACQILRIPDNMDATETTMRFKAQLLEGLMLQEMLYLRMNKNSDTHSSGPRIIAYVVQNYNIPGAKQSSTVNFFPVLITFMPMDTLLEFTNAIREFSLNNNNSQGLHATSLLVVADLILTLSDLAPKASKEQLERILELMTWLQRMTKDGIEFQHPDLKQSDSDNYSLDERLESLRQKLNKYDLPRPSNRLNKS